MFNDTMRLLDRFVGVFKRRIYGKTFRCPVCHLELSEHDVDAHGNLVCPVCAVVIELHQTYGYFVPVVNDVEVERVQPKARLHPLATHLPIGLLPFALLGAGVLLLVSLYVKLFGVAPGAMEFIAQYAPVIENATFLMLLIGVAFSVLTFLTGFVDWRHRYRGRWYRVIALKLILSAIFLISGLIVVLLHWFVFQGGLIGFDSLGNVIAAIFYFGFFGVAFFIMATLGHIGGYLVFGK